MNRQQMMQVLIRIQNSVEFHNIDLLIITACRPAMPEAELEAHILANFARLSDARKREVLDFTRDLKAA